MADMKARIERADTGLERHEAIKVDALCTWSMVWTNVRARPCVTSLRTVRRSSLRDITAEYQISSPIRFI